MPAAPAQRRVEAFERRAVLAGRDVHWRLWKIDKELHISLLQTVGRVGQPLQLRHDATAAK